VTAKLNPLTAARSPMKGWHSISVHISSSLEQGLSELVKIGGSQVNGCANPHNRHTMLINVINRWNHIAVDFSAWGDPADEKAAAKEVAA
jgi:hypothetical protein